MKVISNNICYIEKDDVDYLKEKYNFDFSCIKEKVYYSSKHDFVKIENKCLIDLIKKEEDILDYNNISKLLLENIDVILKKNNSSYYTKSIVNYFSNKSLYDDEINMMLKDKYKRIKGVREMSNIVYVKSDDESKISVMSYSNHEYKSGFTKRLKKFFGR